MLKIVLLTGCLGLLLLALAGCGSFSLNLTTSEEAAKISAGGPVQEHAGKAAVSFAEAYRITKRADTEADTAAQNLSHEEAVFQGSEPALVAEAQDNAETRAMTLRLVVVLAVVAALSGITVFTARQLIRGLRDAREVIGSQVHTVRVALGPFSMELPAVVDPPLFAMIRGEKPTNHVPDLLKALLTIGVEGVRWAGLALTAMGDREGTTDVGHQIARSAADNLFASLGGGNHTNAHEEDIEILPPVDHRR